MKAVERSLWRAVRSSCVVSAMVLGLFAARQRAEAQEPRQPTELAKEAAPVTPPEPMKEATLPVPPETRVATRHDWTAGSRTVHYTATAGNLLIDTGGERPEAADGTSETGRPGDRTSDNARRVNGSIFYVAYTEDGVPSGSRPITFLYNGGPGSASLWLHMGSVGPVRVVTESPRATGGAPFRWVPNPYSLLDRSDLVFVDAPMTGFSRAVGRGTAKDFAGVDQDVKAFESFIVRYITVNQRWNSPKFLFGESYGTPRSAALVAALNNDGVEFNGVVLLSSILNYDIRDPGYDTETKTYLPSYSAIAWYYKKVPQTGTMQDFVQKAREFSRGPYAAALEQGDRLPAAEFDSMAAQVAGFTGLSVEYVKRSKLRISPTRFRKELLRGDDQILGRYDARFGAFDTDTAGENPGFDPSNTGIAGVFVGAFHEYLQTELKYMSTESYDLQGPGIIQSWDWKHKPSGTAAMGYVREQLQPDTVIDLADAMRKNPHLKVFSANGWFDLATPFFGTEHDLAQMMLPPEIASNVQFGYYPAGHMVYLNVDALKAMHADLEKWYPTAVAP